MDITPPVPTPMVASHVFPKPVVRIKDGSFGHSQDYLYDNLDQYAWHEIDPASIKGPALEWDHINDLEKWIVDMPLRKLKSLARARNNDENWSH